MTKLWPYPDEEPDDGSEEDPEFVDPELAALVREYYKRQTEGLG